MLKAAIRAAANAIISLKYNLNEWGGVSDGRFGSKVSLILEHALSFAFLIILHALALIV